MAPPRSTEPAPHELSTGDLAQLRRVIEPAATAAPGARPARVRDGVPGVAIGRVGLGVFDVSPRAALLHIFQALATEGFGARRAMPPDACAPRHTAT